MFLKYVKCQILTALPTISLLHMYVILQRFLERYTKNKKKCIVTLIIKQGNQLSVKEDNIPTASGRKSKHTGF
jgi:hypothetical protein